MENKTKPPVTVADLAKLEDAIERLREAIPLLALTPEERERAAGEARIDRWLERMDENLVAVHKNQEALPISFDRDAFDSDADLANHLRSCLESLDQLRESIVDTYIVVGTRLNEQLNVARVHMRAESLIARKTPTRKRSATERAEAIANPAPVTAPMPPPTVAVAPTPVNSAEPSATPLPPAQNAA